jgi:hypothetical protein
MDTPVVVKQKAFKLNIYIIYLLCCRLVEYKLKLVACYYIKDKNCIANYQKFCLVTLALSSFHKKRSVSLTSGCDPHGCEFSIIMSIIFFMSTSAQ